MFKQKEAVVGAIVAILALCCLAGAPSSWLPITYSIVLWAIIGSIPVVRSAGITAVYGTIGFVLISNLWLDSVGPTLDWKHQAWLARCLDVAWVVILAVLALFWHELRSNKHNFKRAILMLLFPCIVAIMSSGKGGPGLFAKLATEYLHMTQAQAGEFELICRKTIHFVFYGTVGAVGFWAAFMGEATNARAATLGLIFCFSLACFDEIRQSSFPNRSGSFVDVLLDMAGGCTFICISCALRNLISRKTYS